MNTDAEWKLVEHEYVTGKESYIEIAERMNVPLSTVKKRGTRDKWVDKRNQHILAVETKTLESMLSMAKNEAVEQKTKVRIVDTFDAIAEIDWLLQQTKSAIENPEHSRKLSELVSTRLKLIISRNELTPKAIANDDDGWD